jgi:gamma-glutamyltranspeptidase/glutathione hydrolase
MLGILEGFDLGQLGFGAPAALHLMVEAKKMAFGERQRVLGDPQYVKVPIDEILSPKHLDELRARIHLDQALPEPMMKDKKLYGGDTTYLCCVDSEGNTVSYIHSLYTGCGVVMGDTGVLMSSRMLGFSLHEEHPNVLAPGKRPVHTLNTFLVLDNGVLRVVGGTPGADMQVQTNLQVITNLLDFGMDVVEAVDAPRWGSHDGFRVVLEDRFPSEVGKQLVRRGHAVEIKPAWSSSGSIQLIGISPEPRVFVGSTEPRHNGGHIAAY